MQRYIDFENSNSLDFTLVGSNFSFEIPFEYLISHLFLNQPVEVQYFIFENMQKYEVLLISICLFDTSLISSP
jgi:hypothetical protein